MTVLFHIVLQIGFCSSVLEGYEEQSEIAARLFLFFLVFFFIFLNLTPSNILSTARSTSDISKETTMPRVSLRCSSIKFHFCFIVHGAEGYAEHQLGGAQHTTAEDSLAVRSGYKNKEVIHVTHPSGIIFHSGVSKLISW